MVPTVVGLEKRSIACIFVAINLDVLMLFEQ